MADEFAIEPGLGNFPDALGELASQMNELAALLDSPPDCAIHQGDSEPFHATCTALRESLKGGGAELRSFADASGGVGDGLVASDGV
jgi:hypothetical protein